MTLAILTLCLSGCTPRTIVRKNPSDCDTGVRYYRPKPYLLVTPVEEIITSSRDQRTTRPGPNFVNIQLEYLPDFSEEYSITVRSGLGINDTSFKLENGWNLTEMGQDLDSQFDENVEAIAGLIESAGKIVGTAGVPDANAAFRMAASNVPIGYYESVIGRDPGGRKQLYGWRYIGFAPMQPCPIVTGGAHCNDCQTMDLYHLVFRKGKMVFEPMHELRRAEEVTARREGPIRDEATEHLPIIDDPVLPTDGRLQAARAMIDSWIERNAPGLEVFDYRIELNGDRYRVVLELRERTELPSSLLQGLKDDLGGLLGVSDLELQVLSPSTVDQD